MPETEPGLGPVMRRLGYKPWSELTASEQAAASRYTEFTLEKGADRTWMPNFWWRCDGGDIWGCCNPHPMTT